MQTKISDIEKALKIAAKIVKLYGDSYLPTFSRLHTELLNAKKQEQEKMVALELAMGYSELR